MKRSFALLVAVSTVVAFGALVRPGHATGGAHSSLPATHSVSHGQVARAFGKLPLSFEPNVGQTDPRVSFISHGHGFTLFLTPGEAVLSLRERSGRPESMAARGGLLSPATGTTEVLTMRLTGADPKASIVGESQLPGISNYFIGNDPQAWHTSIPNFARVSYPGVYPGVDVTFHGNQTGQLEYDFTVAPRADPSVIGLGFEGQQQLSLDGRGDLVLRLSGGDIRQAPPFAYQMIGGTRASVPISYLLDGNTVRFAVGHHDPSLPLVIDPAISYSTYLGGSSEDFGSAIAVDRFRSAYLFGETTSTDFPVTPGAYQPGYKGGDTDDFVAKLNRDGTALLYSTYLGGSAEDESFGIDVDHAGNAYLAGPTLSLDFPTTPGAFQETAPGGDHDGFVTKLDPTGSALVYSTYLGGSDHDAALTPVVDTAGDVYVIGDTNSDDLPVTPDAFQKAPSGGDCKIFDIFDPGDCEEEGGLDMFVAKLNRTGSDVLYLTYLGASGDEVGIGMDVDRGGNAYIALETDSTDFPTTPGAYQTTFAGGDGTGFDTAPTDNVIIKLNPTGSGLVYSTYLGGSGDECDAFFCYLTIDKHGHVFLASNSDSTDFPVTPGAVQDTNHGSFDYTMTELNSAGSGLVYSTYLGGSDYDAMTSDALGRNGDLYVAGITLSTDFPTKDPVQPSFGGINDGTLSVLNKGGSDLLFSTYLGGNDDDEVLSMGVDASGAAYLGGFTVSADFPVTAGAFQTSLDGFIDAFITKMLIHGDAGSVSVLRGSSRGVPGTKSGVSGLGRWRSP